MSETRSKLKSFLCKEQPPRKLTKIGDSGIEIELRRISASDWLAIGAKAKGNQDQFARLVVAATCWIDDEPAFEGDDGFSMLCDLFANQPIIASNLYVEIINFLQGSSEAEAEREKNS